MDLQANRSFTISDLECMLIDEAAEPKALPFSLLEKITNGFSYKQEIGRGGFAVVYMGVLENRAVAVKKLTNTYKYESEFLREVECLMKVKHKNIVRFLGYCSDTQGHVSSYNGKFVMVDLQERLLCFEYLPKGSLDTYIKDVSGGLEWKIRYGIIKGICEGLDYLHSINIMHLDLKPSNILMDDNMIPKITDFGLSRSLEEMQTRVIATKMFGTIGYLAPEFTSHVVTRKFDLYSLGVIILEILTGDKACQVVENRLRTDDAMGLLAAPICSLLSSSLTDLQLYGTYQEMERFTKEQEDALHILASLQELYFCNFSNLQSLPAGLHKLTNLKKLMVYECLAVQSLPEDGLPKSMQELDVLNCGNDELKQQCKGLVGTIPKIKLGRGY